MRRRMIAITAMALSVLMVTGVAVAQEAPADGVEAPQAITDVIEVDGDLYARGQGHVVLHSAGLLRLTVAANVRIIDHAGDATIALRPADAGDAIEGTDATRVVLEHFRGVIVVRGSAYTVRIRGHVPRLMAAGHGSAYFNGEGVWTAGNVAGNWNGVRILYR